MKRATRSLSSRLTLVLVAGALLPAARGLAQADAAAPQPASAKTWLGREAEFEEFLETAEPVSLEPIGIGVTNPLRAGLEPGGPVPAFVWKPLRPGIYGGFFESYKTEVAAYELDKILELGMVPVTVERLVGKARGAACMWAEPAKSFKELGGPPKAPSEQRERWNIQLVRAKMFDNLISNKDPNLGNWLVDPAWNLLLIDHSRSFDNAKAMAHELTRVDASLWERMQRLDERLLTEALDRWLTRKQIRAVLKRRDAMGAIIADLVAKSGESAVMVRYDEPIR